MILRGDLNAFVALRSHFLWLAILVFHAGTQSLDAAQPNGGEASPLVHAHAHNDYVHARPLFDALDRGFWSVEADVFLVDDQLLIGHSWAELSPERTLKKLYLDPLQKLTLQRKTELDESEPITLLIDLKMEGPATYAALRKLLAEYSSMLSTMDGDTYTPKAVTVIITGYRPIKQISAANPRYVGIDGRLSDLNSNLPAHLMPLISDKWEKHFQWRGIGPMPTDERDRLREMVKKAHAQGRRVRFWATPEVPALWDELLDAGVDLIAVDDLDRLQSYLAAREDGPSPSRKACVRKKPRPA